METLYRHIGWWIGGMMMLLCIGCGGSDDHDGDTPDEVSGPQLEIRVYTPEPSQVTRGDIGEVGADEDERVINSLSIWVFESSNGNLVGYLNPSEMPTTESKTYRISVSETFATERPDVDVYVIANVSNENTGISLNRNSLRSALNDAVITESHFGLTSPPVTSVPAGVKGGLPMSGILKNQPVTGLAPIVRVSTNVKVMRAVSKMRFVFSRAKSENTEDNLTITKITLIPENNSTDPATITTIPLQEKLFLDGDNFNVSGGYYTEEKILIAPTDIAIPTCDKPAKYAYVNQTGEEYEKLINDALQIEPAEEREIVQLGKLYLRESDKQLEGKIYYKTKTNGVVSDEKSVTFKMSDAGDFSRNHTWIVYGYYAGQNNLKIFNVTVLPWDTSEADHDVYNW